MFHIDLFPARNWLNKVNGQTIQKDAFAGFTNAAIVLPQGVAFATIAGLPPEYGLYTAIITAIIVQLWFKEINLSLLIAVSMILNMIVAGLFGILVPVSLKKINIDPALPSSVFVTTITDVIGFLSFLGLGSYYFLN